MTRAGGYHGQLAAPAWNYGISRRLFGLLRVALKELAGVHYVSWRRYPVDNPIPSPIPPEMLAEARRMTAERVRERKKRDRRLRADTGRARTRGIRAARKMGLPASSVQVWPKWIDGGQWDGVRAYSYRLSEFDGPVVWESPGSRRGTHEDCLYCKAGEFHTCPDGSVPF
jgi:hypothetical protein